MPIVPYVSALSDATRRATDVPGLDKFQVHTWCFAAWEFERMKAQPDLALRPDGADSRRADIAGSAQVPARPAP